MRINRSFDILICTALIDHIFIPHAKWFVKTVLNDRNPSRLLPLGKEPIRLYESSAAGRKSVQDHNETSKKETISSFFSTLIL